MKKYYLLSFIAIWFLTSCFKEEDPVKPFDRGDRQTATIEMTNDYIFQVYFDLDKGVEVSTNQKNDYDLAFDSSTEGSTILVNTSIFMQAALTDKTTMDEVTSASGLDFRFDASSGNPDSTAIGKWFAIHETDTIFPGFVYVINRGIDLAGNPLGFKKIIFTGMENQTYHFQYADLDGSNHQVGNITKRPGYNFVYYSFDTKDEISTLEPERDQYSLLFTQYTTLLFTDVGDPYPYLVTGVLLNRFQTLAALVQDRSFDEIDLGFATGLELSSQNDRIGYDWKEVKGDLEGGNVFYEVWSDYNYIIRDHQGFYFKMRFVGFYNQQGEKGYPTFEFQRL
ncbi:MAG: HmuY family protein [Bacteroidales bacterium]|nr:HmuY family protein [Bacteroidales bacterium]